MNLNKYLKKVKHLIYDDLLIDNDLIDNLIKILTNYSSII